MSSHEWPGRMAILRLLVVGFAAFTGMQAQAVTGELFIADLRTGVALYGFDPVAFFLDRKPQLGSEAFELEYGGATFRFLNDGNRAAFKAHPEVYIPHFGGYDPVAVSRGSPAPGFPNLFLIRDEQLFFFSNEQSRKSFVANAQEVLAAAEAAWPRVKRNLVH